MEVGSAACSLLKLLVYLSLYLLDLEAVYRILYYTRLHRQHLEVYHIRFCSTILRHKLSNNIVIWCCG